MPTLVDIEGFEHQVAKINATATMNPPLWATAATTGLTFAAGADGIGKCVHLAPDGTNGCRLVRNLTTAGTLVVASFKMRLIQNPTTIWTRVFHLPADIVAAVGPDTDGTIAALVSGGTKVTGPSIADGNWHRVDVRYNTSPATHTLDWAVDGVNQTQATGAGVAASNITQWGVGSNTAPSTDHIAEVDDVVISQTTGDYPLGPHSVFSVVPAADGTHVAGTNIMENAGTGNDINGTTETAWDKLDDWPPTTGINNADSITSSASGATNYVEVTFGTPPAYATSALWAVLGIVAHQSDTTGANTGITRIVNSAGTTLTDIFSGDMSEITDHYTWKLITPPSGGWLLDATHFNGIKGRIGFGTLQPGAPEWLALMVSAATPDEPTVAAASAVPRRRLRGTYEPEPFEPWWSG